jgi:magnesium/cobalt transport protein CorA
MEHTTSSESVIAGNNLSSSSPLSLTSSPSASLSLKEFIAKDSQNNIAISDMDSKTRDDSPKFQRKSRISKKERQKPHANNKMRHDSKSRKQQKDPLLGSGLNYPTSNESIAASMSESFTIDFSEYSEIDEKVEQIWLIEEKGWRVVPIEKSALDKLQINIQSSRPPRVESEHLPYWGYQSGVVLPTAIPPSSNNVQSDSNGPTPSEHRRSSPEVSLQKETKQQNAPLWLNIFYPSQDTMNHLQTLFDIHPLTIEDCLNSAECREKNETFEHYRFLVVNEVHYPPQSNELVEVTVYILVFSNVIITIHQAPVRCVDAVIYRLRKLKADTSYTTDWVMHALLDAIVDMFYMYVDPVKREVIDLEELVLILSAREQSDILRRINLARNRVVFLRSQLLKKKETVLSLLSKSSSNKGGAMGEQTRLYLRDVLDHVLCLFDDIEMAKEQLTHLTNTYLARVSIQMAEVSNQLNGIMKKFNAMATIILPLTFVTGLWGMNVLVPGGGEPTLIPFFSIVGSMVIFSIISVTLFRKFRWL